MASVWSRPQCVKNVDRILNSQTPHNAHHNCELCISFVFWSCWVILSTQNITNSSTGPKYIWDPTLAITAPADALPPDGARPLTGTAMVTKACVFPGYFTIMIFNFISATWWRQTKWLTRSRATWQWSVPGLESLSGWTYFRCRNINDLWGSCRVQ